MPEYEDYNAEHSQKNAAEFISQVQENYASHGVDQDSFNLMYFFGMPNNNAEYIQAYSRVGRKYAGIVIDIIRLMRVRDRSYLKNFIVFHQNKDDLVESVPVNRWAKNAIYSTLPGMLSGLLIGVYLYEDKICPERKYVICSYVGDLHEISSHGSSMLIECQIYLLKYQIL